MAGRGADILDVGGESTRPAPPLREKRSCGACCRSSSGWQAGAHSHFHRHLQGAGRPRGARAAAPPSSMTSAACQYDSALGAVAAASGAALVLMHTRGRSAGMYRFAVYGCRTGRGARARRGDRCAVRAGVSRDAIIVDPGLGFAKRAEHSYDVLARWTLLAALHRPILSGPSRKSFLKAAWASARRQTAMGHGGGRGGQRAARRAHRPRARRQGDGRRGPRVGPPSRVGSANSARGSQGDPHGSPSLYITPPAFHTALTGRIQPRKPPPNEAGISRRQMAAQLLSQPLLAPGRLGRTRTGGY